MFNKTYENAFTVRVESILKITSYVEKCRELKKIFEENSNTTLDQVYQMIVSDIFGVSGRGWMLLASPNCITKFQHSEVAAVKDFLDAKGPFFRVIERLQSEPGCKYELPVCIAGSSMFSKNFEKPDPAGNLTTPACLRLPAFEFYIYSFAYCMMNNTQYGAFHNSHNSALSIHNSLLSNYLEYFVPVNGSYPPVSNISIAPSRSASSSISGGYTSHTPVKFASNMLKHISPKPAAATVKGNFSYQELWRSDLLVRILIDMWLVFPLHAKDFHHRNLKAAVPEQLVKAVRVLVIHLHSVKKDLKVPVHQSSNDSVMEQFLHNIFTFLHPKLFVFLVTCFERWPLDGSFRAVTETWISFIQPWRYAVDQSMPEKDKRLAEDYSVANRWFSFIAVNVSFYNQLLYMALVRFMRMDLSVEENAFLLVRTTRIFNQANLKQMIEEAESGPLQQDTMLYYKGQNTTVRKNSSVDCSFQNMTSTETRTLAAQLIGVCQKALNTINKQVAPKSNTGIISWIEQFFNITEACEPETSSSKTAKHLTSSIERLSEIFDIEVKNVNKTLESEMNNRRAKEISAMDSSIYYKDGVLNLTTEGRYELMNNLKKVPVLPKCDPDLQPIKSHECAFLVRKLHKISKLINHRYQDKLERVCARDDCLGAITRYYFEPTFSIKGLSPFALDNMRKLPPRVSLRFLAHHGVLFYFAVFLVFCKISGYSILSLGFKLLSFVLLFIGLNSLAICYKVKCKKE